MINKGGASSHLEVIISFTLFSMFVLSLLFYVNPYKSTTLPDTLLENIEESFIQDNSVDLTKFFLIINVAHTPCMNVLLPSSINLTGQDSEVFISSGGSVDSTTSGGFFISSSEDDFYVLLSSEFYSEPNCDSPVEIDCGAGECSIGSVQSRKIISETQVLLMVFEYESDYESLKLRLGIPENVDFAIVSEGFEMEMYIPADLEVISRVHTLEVLYSDGSILNKEFVFKIW